jgi:hypothetical protein
VAIGAAALPDDIASLADCAPAAGVCGNPFVVDGTLEVALVTGAADSEGGELSAAALLVGSLLRLQAASVNPPASATENRVKFRMDQTLAQYVLELAPCLF